MVFGNMGDDSGTGVAFTRDPNTGEKVLYGEYLTNAQGEDVVAGIRTPQKISQLRDEMPEGLRRVPADRGAPRAPLPRRPGPRVHDRARPALHAPDPLRQADRGGRREDRGGHGGRGHHHEGRGGPAGSSPPRSTSCCATSSTRTPAEAATRIAKGLNASPGAAVGKAVFDADRAAELAAARREGHPRADRDLAGRLPRHGRGAGRAHGARRRDVPRGGGGAADRQAVRGRRERAAHRLRDATAGRSTADLRRGRLDQPRRLDGRGLPRRACPRSRCASRTRPGSSGSSAGPTRCAASRSGPTPTSRRRRRSRAATAPRASASAGPSTCSARASASRSSATRSSSRSRRRGPRSGAPPARRSAPRGRGRHRAVRRRDGEARGAPGGRLPGHLRGDERPAGRRSGSSTRRSTSSCRTTRSCSSRSRAADARRARDRPGAACQGRELLARRRGAARAEPDAGPARLPARA